MTLLGGRDVIQNGHQDGRHLGFHKKFKFIVKTRKLQIYFAKVVKYNRYGRVNQFFDRQKRKTRILIQK